MTRNATDTGMVRQVADDVLSGTAPAADADGLDPVWPQICDLGWPLIGVDEEHAGSGGSLRDLVDVLTAVGAHAVSVPLAETALASWVLAEAGRADLLGDPGAVRTVAFPWPSDPVEIRGRGGHVRVEGEVGRVPWASVAADILVPVGGQMLMLDRSAPGREFEPGHNLAGEPRETVRIADSPATVVSGPSLSDVKIRASQLRGAQLIGALEGAVRSTSEHVRGREQFGRPLASFQLVSSGVATMVSETAAAQAAFEAAMVEMEHGHAAREPYAEAARVVLGRAATEVARLAHQLHGAMGITREHHLHRVSRRLWSWRDEWGAQHLQAARLGARTTEAGPDELWQLVTAPDEWSKTA